MAQNISDHHTKSSEQNSQFLSSQEGNFTQMGNEFLEKLLEFNLAKNEWRLVVYFMRQLAGWKVTARPFSFEQLMTGSKLPKTNVFCALEGLIKKGVIVKTKAKGVRAPLYGFNENVFERIVVGKPLTFWEENSKVLNLRTFKVLQNRTIKVPENHIFRNRRSATRAASRGSKYTSNKVLNIFSKDFCIFLNNQPRATKARWERVISDILRNNPKDESELLTAIELVHKNKKDFLGNPIERSIIGLFEKTEWPLMKEAMMMQLKKIDEKEEREKLLRNARDTAKPASEVNISDISPQFRRYAYPPKEIDIEKK